jgi:hypothetical protein
LLSSTRHTGEKGICALPFLRPSAAQHITHDAFGDQKLTTVAPQGDVK